VKLLRKQKFSQKTEADGN